MTGVDWPGSGPVQVQGSQAWTWTWTKCPVRADWWTWTRTLGSGPVQVRTMFEYFKPAIFFLNFNIALRKVHTQHFQSYVSFVNMYNTITNTMGSNITRYDHHRLGIGIAPVGAVTLITIWFHTTNNRTTCMPSVCATSASISCFVLVQYSLSFETSEPGQIGHLFCCWMVLQRRWKCSTHMCTKEVTPTWLVNTLQSNLDLDGNWRDHHIIEDRCTPINPQVRSNTACTWASWHRLYVGNQEWSWCLPGIDGDMNHLKRRRRIWDMLGESGPEEV